MLYSPLKIFHHRGRIDALQRGEQPNPAQVQLIITNRCNHRCKFCSYRMPGYTSNQMFNAADEIPYAKVLEIIDDCREMEIPAIQVTGGGEPTIHPQFSEIVEQIVSRGLQLAIVTNGNVLPEKSIPTLACATWVRFSIDAAEEATYRSLRGVGEAAFKKTWKNIDRLVVEKYRQQSDVVIGIGFVVTRENFREVVTATQQAKDAGVDNIRLSAVFQNDGADYFDAIHPEAIELCREAVKLQTPTFRVFNNFDHRFEDLELAHPDYSFCGIQHFNTYIGADLNVYRCCVNAYNRLGLIGSIRNHRFATLWRSAWKRYNFAEFDARKCSWCMFNEKNRTIAYAIANNPPHVNFV